MDCTEVTKVKVWEVVNVLYASHLYRDYFSHSIKDNITYMLLTIQ